MRVDNNVMQSDVFDTKGEACQQPEAGNAGHRPSDVWF
jgi:hypothetical protein